MATDKSIQFKFVVDDNSFSRVRKALQDLTAEAAKFQKAMSGGQGGGGGNGMFGGMSMGRPGSAGQTITGANGRNANAGGATPITAALLKDVDAFKALGKEGGLALQVLSSAVKKSLQEQEQDIGRLQNRVKGLLENYKELGRADKGGAKGQVLMENLFESQSSLHGAKNQYQESLKVAREAGWGGGAPPKGPGFLSRFGGAASEAFSAMAGPAAIIAAGAGAILSSTIQNNAMGYGLYGARTDVLSAEITKRYRGDVRSDVLAGLGRRNVDSEMRKEMRDAVNGTAVNIQAVGNGVMDGTVGSLLGMVGIGKGGNGFTMAGLTDTGLGNEHIKRALEVQAAQTKLAEARQTLAYDEIVIGEAGSRRGYSHRFGLGLYKDTSKVAAALAASDARLESQINDPSLSDVQRENRRKYRESTRAERNQYITERATTNDLKRSDPMQTMKVNIAKARLSEEEFFAGHGQSLGLGMGGAFAGAIAGASNAGYGGYGQMLAAAARGMGTTRGADIMGKYLFSTGMSKQAAIELGSSIYGYDSRGTTSGTGLASLIQNSAFSFGGDPIADANNAARIQGGIGLMDRVVGGGTSPYQRGRNILSAYSANPNGSFQANDYLANGMTFKQLTDAARGELTLDARQLGVSPGMARKQLGGSMSSVFDSVAISSTDVSPMARTLRKLRDSKMSAEEFIKANKGDNSVLEGLTAAFKRGSGGTTEDALGAVGLMAGIDGKKLAKNIGAPYGGTDDVKKAEEEAKLKNRQELLATLPSVVTATFQELAKNPTLLKQLMHASDNKGADNMTIQATTVTLYTDHPVKTH